MSNTALISSNEFHLFSALIEVQKCTHERLTLQDFTGVMKVPGQVALGTTLQYTVMPLMGFSVSRLAGLSSPLAVG